MMLRLSLRKCNRLSKAGTGVKLTRAFGSISQNATDRLNLAVCYRILDGKLPKTSFHHPSVAFVSRDTLHLTYLLDLKNEFTSMYHACTLSIYSLETCS